MITLGAQYYRPPFPRSNHWETDLAGMKEAGLNTVQLWLVWGWIESVPGTFDYSDYDTLVEIAKKNELKVVLSTIAAIHPYWIHREVPGSEMITNMGQKVVSTNRRECHYGLTPGGCIDHPGVRERQDAFLRETASHYAGADHVVGWDVWNELRWNVHADGLVCYCEHTIAAYHEWLEAKFGDLDGVNAAWERRYGSWDEVLPGKRPNRVYTEMMAFQDFIMDRSSEHAKWRYRIVKELNPGKPVTVHGGKPTVLYGTDSYEGENPSTSLHRGNDWDFADEIDGVGTSSFPVWEGIDHTDFIARIDFVRAAAEQKGRKLWLSELQGGRSAAGFEPQSAVTAAAQQRWIWSGLAAGADTVLFWCWRDEIFGRESGGFGIIGADGRAAERVAALERTGSILTQYEPIFDRYALPPAKVGIWFSPQSYFLTWAEEGDAKRVMQGLQGLSRALVRQSIPYTIIEEHHTDALADLSVLFVPRGIVVGDQAADALVDFVERGGRLVVEGESGGFGENGIFRYPQERFLERMGIREVGRRPLPAENVPVSIAPDRGSEHRSTYFVPAVQWATPYTNGAVTQQETYGKGDVVAIGLYAAEAYYAGQRLGDETHAAAGSEFERLVADLITGAGVPQQASIVEAEHVDELAHVRIGKIGRTPVVYVISELVGRALTLRIHDAITAAELQGGVINLLTRQTALMKERTIVLPPSEWGVWILVPQSAA